MHWPRLESSLARMVASHLMLDQGAPLGPLFVLREQASLAPTPWRRGFSFNARTYRGPVRPNSIACQRQRNADDSENEDGDRDPEGPSLPTLCRDLLFPKPSDGKFTLGVRLDGGRPRAHGLTAKRLELGAPLEFSTILLAGASLPRLFFDYLG